MTETETILVSILNVSPIPLTAGAVLRIAQRDAADLPSRTTIQRILDRLVAAGTIETVTRTIEINGHIKDARHYASKTNARRVAVAQSAYNETERR